MPDWTAFTLPRSTSRAAWPYSFVWTCRKQAEKNICRFGRDEEELEGLSWRVKVTDPDGKVILTETCPEQAVIENPRLWWPNGYGEQPLYLVEAELLRMEKYWIAGAAVSACAR